MECKLCNHWKDGACEMALTNVMGSCKMFEDRGAQSSYLLMNKNAAVCEFELSVSSGRLQSVVSVNIGKVILWDICRRALGGKIDSESMLSFLESRKAPKNRAFIDTLVSMMGMDTIKDYLDISYGLSLTDTLWVKPAGIELTWDEVSLYQNSFNDVIAQFAFTGTGLHGLQASSTSPEFGTNGMLPKCWRRINGIVKLFKGGTRDYANAGREPFMEFYAGQVAKAMGLEFVPYELDMYKGYLTSICELFTSESSGYMPASAYIRANTNTVEQVVELYESIDCLDALYDMILFDSVICNTDRHLGNFGLMIDNDSLKPFKAAPIFDNGMSLGVSFMSRTDGATIEAYIKKANEAGSALFGDFVKIGKEVLSPRRKKILRGLLEFEFTPSEYYVIKEPNIDFMSSLVRHQASAILR